MAEIPIVPPGSDEPFDINEPTTRELPPESTMAPVQTLAVVPPIDTLTIEERILLLRDLKEAFYSGAQRIRFRERDVIYRKLSEMQLIIADLEASINVSTRRPRAAVFTTFGRGY